MNPQLILKKPSEFTGLNRYSATQFILHGGRGATCSGLAEYESLVFVLQNLI